MFKYAIVRKLPKNFSEGTTNSNLGKPNYEKALRQHDSYCKALEKCGLSLVVLESDLRFPDGVFVEDTAVVTEEEAIITNLGSINRRGEEEVIKQKLSKFRRIHQIKSPGTVDGGDILKIEDHFYIGISKRTNREGSKQLSSLLSKNKYSSSFIPVRGILHLKTGVTYIGNNNLVSIGEFSKSEYFKQFNIIGVDKEERCAANCLLVNNTLLIAKPCLKLKQKLRTLDCKIVELNISEFQKMDGGLTCLSLLF